MEHAAQAFVSETDALDAAVPLLGWESPEGPDPERNTRLVPLLQKAMDGYAQAIDTIESVLVQIGTFG